MTEIFHNEAIRALAKNDYSTPEIESIESLLIDNGLFDFEIYPQTGLFPATHMGDDINNYNSVWLRDTIHIANALFASGMDSEAKLAVCSLVDFYISHIDRWQSVINDPSLAKEPMNRPHVRFDGESLSEIDAKWSHAQNDAIGYLLWLVVKLMREGLQSIELDFVTMLQVIPIYLNAIEFWNDADSGHWEEEQKVEASSIGVCIAALESLAEYCAESPKAKQAVGQDILDLVDSMIETSRTVFEQILPNESVKSNDQEGREVDGALLFLCYPLRVVSSQQSRLIRKNVQEKLQGDYGIRRYLGDSFWTKNYPDLMNEADLTRDFSDDISERDKLAKVGEEAQWCIFDSIMSVTYGLDYLETNDQSDKTLQTFYFNRAIGQVTGDDSKFGPFMMPEAYYLQGEEYIANDATPLQWAKANLIHAFRLMKQTHCATLDMNDHHNPREFGNDR